MLQSVLNCALVATNYYFEFHGLPLTRLKFQQGGCLSVLAFVSAGFYYFLSANFGICLFKV